MIKELLPEDVMTVRVDPDTGRIEPVQGAPETPELAVHMANRYRSIAISLMDEAEDILCMTYAPDLRATGGSSPRFLSGVTPGSPIAASCFRDRDAPHEALVVAIGPDFCAADMDDARLTEVIATDLTNFLHGLYPVRCEGPIKVLMPWLVQIVGNVVIPSAAGESREAVDRRKQNAIGRAIRGFSETNYGGRANAHGQLSTDFPALSPVAEAVGNEACILACTTRSPMGRREIVLALHEVIAQAMRNVDVPVYPGGSRA